MRFPAAVLLTLALAVPAGPAVAESAALRAEVIADVTGDSVGDVVVWRGEPDPWMNAEREFSIHHGSHGERVWGAAYEHPVSVTPVSMGANPGVVVVEHAETDFWQRAALAVESRRHDGTLAWRKTLPPPALDWTQRSEVVAVGRHSPGAAGDIVVLSQRFALVGRVTTIEALDAATGRVRSTVTLAGPDVRVFAAGDVSGDGFDDLFVWLQAQPMSVLQAYSTTSPVPLWSRPWDRSATPNVLPSEDLTGDGRADIVLEDQSADVSRGQTRMLALDGATGLTLWSRAVWPTGTVGDIDGDGDRDVVGWRGGRGGVVFEGVDASGNVTTRSFPAGPDSDGRSAGPAGDLDADGITDQRIQIDLVASAVRQAVSVRTGSVIADETYGVYLNASVDGIGDDIVELTYDQAGTDILARDGGGSAIWSTHLPGVEYAFLDCSRTCAADASGDERADVVAYAPGRVWVFDGATGHVLWSI